MPTFAIGAGPEYVNGDEGWGAPDTPPFRSDENLSWHLINHLVDPNWVTQFSSEDIIEKVGTAGLELIMWVAARNTLQGPVREVHRNYHIPISNTAAGTQAFAPA